MPKKNQFDAKSSNDHTQSSETKRTVNTRIQPQNLADVLAVISNIPTWML